MNKNPFYLGARRANPIKMCGSIALVFTLVLLLAQGAFAVTIVHYAWLAGGQTAPNFINAVARQFEKENPGITIDVQSTAGLYDQKLQLLITGGMEPDTTECNEGNGGRLVDQGVFLDLRPYFNEEPSLKTQIVPVALEASTWIDGTMWSLPRDVYPNITLYNADLFSTRGLTPPDKLGKGWTWETFFKYAGRATVDTNGDGTTDQWGVTDTLRWWAQEALVHQAGGFWSDTRKNPRKATVDTPEVLTALEFMLDISRAGVIGPIAQFNAGNVALLEAFAPARLGKLGSTLKFQWGIAEQLQGPKNSGGLVTTNGFQIMKSSKHPDIAWKWLRYLTNESNSLKYAAETAYIPVTRSAINKYPQAIGRPAAEAAPLLAAIINPASYHNLMGSPVDIRTEAGNNVYTRVVDKGENPRAVLADVHAQINAKLAQGYK